MQPWRSWLLLIVALWTCLAPTAQALAREEPADLRKYLYAHVDPAGRVDPSGHFSMPEIIQAAQAIGTIATIAMPTITAYATASLPYIAALGVASSTANILRTFYDDDYRAYRTGTVMGAVETTLDVSGLGGGFYALQKGLLALRSAINSGRSAIQVVSTTTPVFETGVNITPRSVMMNYRTIGGSTNGYRTSVTTVENVESVIGSMDTGRIIITRAQASALESTLGLKPNSLERINVISIIRDIKARGPASPISGNTWFQGGGAGLPGGGPELTISSVSSAGNSGVTQLILEVIN